MDEAFMVGDRVFITFFREEDVHTYPYYPVSWAENKHGTILRQDARSSPDRQVWEVSIDGSIDYIEEFYLRRVKNMDEATPSYTVVGEPFQKYHNGEWLIDVQHTITGGVESVPMAFVGEGKVQYVKRLRERLACGLSTAKYMADAIMPATPEPATQVATREVVVERLPAHLLGTLIQRTRGLKEAMQEVDNEVTSMCRLFSVENYAEVDTFAYRMAEARGAMGRVLEQLDEALIAAGQGHVFTTKVVDERGDEVYEAGDSAPF